MRTYGIYKVKKMYQPFIIGRERLLYDLLKENGQEKHMQEIQYLCEEFVQQSIDEAVITNLGKMFATIDCNEGEYRLTHPVKGSIHLTISSYSINVICDGSRMLDLDLFAALSGLNDRFFAVMDGQGEWGWLKPVKYADFTMRAEVVN